MRSLGAFVLLAGVGVGLFVYLPPAVDRHASLENARRLWAEADRSSIPRTSRSFSPQIALANVTPPKPPRAERPAPGAFKSARSTVAAVSPIPAHHTTITGWQPVVADANGTIRSGSGAASLKPKNPTSRYKLVVEIQRNLKKRGCYWGRIDGSWGAGSKYAMQAFIERVNATLPFNEPDYVLLTLLQANSDKRCGACPAGQTATVGGSCMAQTTIAGTQRKSGSGGQSGTEVYSWKRDGAPQPAAPPVLRPVGTTIVTTAPLPGRMAIGGPKQLPPPVGADDSWPGSVATVTTEGPNGASVSPDNVASAPATRPVRTTRPARAARRKAAHRSRRRYRGVRAARRRNLMLSLGGAY